jgi:uncharacterized protein YgiM (DUF1202 family)
MTTQRLLEIKVQIDDAKGKQAEIRGKRASTEEQMQTKFGIKTVVASEKELKKRASELDQMEGEFEKGMEELENGYEWKI